MCAFFFSPKIWNTKHPRYDRKSKNFNIINIFLLGEWFNFDVIMTLKSERNIFQMLGIIIQSFDCWGHYHMWWNYLLSFTWFFFLLKLKGSNCNFESPELTSSHGCQVYGDMCSKIYWFHTFLFYHLILSSIYDLILAHNNPGFAHKLHEG